MKPMIFSSRLRFLPLLLAFGIFAPPPLLRSEDDAYKRAREEQDRRERERKEDEYRNRLIEGSGSRSPTGGGDSSAGGGSFAAIAYSMATRNFGYSYNYGSLEQAQRAALSECKGQDAKAIIWAKNGWYCALAVAKDGSYGCASGPTAAKARAEALAACREVAKTNDVSIAVCVYAGK